MDGACADAGASAVVGASCCCVAVTEGAGSAVVAAGVGVATEGADVSVGLAEGVGIASLVVVVVVVVVGSALAGGAMNPSAVVAIASVAKAAESRLRLSPMDIPFFVLSVTHPTGAEQSIIHRLEDYSLCHMPAFHHQRLGHIPLEEPWQLTKPLRDVVSRGYHVNQSGHRRSQVPSLHPIWGPSPRQF